jgi:hypothetical protein
MKQSNPTVPMLVVFDDDGGPGVYNATSANQIESMQSAGITVLGYVPTWWGTRGSSDAESAIQEYRNWYSVHGIYLDQMPNWNYNGPSGQWNYSGPGGEYIPGYFSNLTNYARSIGVTIVVANAGADVPKDFIGSVNTIGTFENPFLPSLNLSEGWLSIAGLGGWHSQYNKSNFMFFAYNVSSINSQYVLSAAGYVGYMYITNGSQSTDRYGDLSPYLGQLVSILASIDH